MANILIYYTLALLDTKIHIPWQFSRELSYENITKLSYICKRKPPSTFANADGG